MGNPIDDAFAAADAKAEYEKREKAEKERRSAIYSAQVEPLVQSYVEAVRAKAQEFYDHPRNTNKPAIMAAGNEITIRRASAIGMQDRHIEVRFSRRDGKLSWKYEASPNLVHGGGYEIIDHGENTFYVDDNDQLQVHNVRSPDHFARIVLDRFIHDCATDMAEAQTKQQ